MSQQQELRIGELLVEMGFLRPADLDEAMNIANQTRLPLGSVMVMSGNLTDWELRAALLGQSLLKDNVISKEDMFSVMRIVRERHVSFEEAMKVLEGGSTQPVDVRETNKLGELLIASGWVTKEQLDEALETVDSSGLPLGRVLVLTGLISEAALKTALDAQVTIRDGSVSRQEGIDRLKNSSSQASVSRISRQMPANDFEKILRLGDFLVKAGILNDTDMLNALEVALSAQRKLGEVLVGFNLVAQELVDVALELQHLTRTRQIRPDQAVSALQMIYQRGMSLHEALGVPNPDQLIAQSMPGAQVTMPQPTSAKQAAPAHEEYAPPQHEAAPAHEEYAPPQQQAASTAEGWDFQQTAPQAQPAQVEQVPPQAQPAQEQVEQVPPQEQPALEEYAPPQQQVAPIAEGWDLQQTAPQEQPAPEEYAPPQQQVAPIAEGWDLQQTAPQAQPAQEQVEQAPPQAQPAQEQVGQAPPQEQPAQEQVELVSQQSRAVQQQTAQDMAAYSASSEGRAAQGHSGTAYGVNASESSAFSGTSASQAASASATPASAPAASASAASAPGAPGAGVAVGGGTGSGGVASAGVSSSQELPVVTAGGSQGAYSAPAIPQAGGGDDSTQIMAVPQSTVVPGVSAIYEVPLHAPGMSPSPVSQELVGLAHMLKLTGIVTQEEIDRAIRDAIRDSVLLHDILRTSGVAEPITLRAAYDAHKLVIGGHLTFEQAMMALDLCKRSKINLYQAFQALGWIQ